MRQQPVRARSGPTKGPGATPLRTVARVASAAETFTGVGTSTLVGYLLVLTLAAHRAKRAGAHRTPLPETPHHKFLVLVPAHNEELLIARLLESLARLDYPSRQFSIHVVTDNCTDATADIVRRFGFEVGERWAPEHGGKGPALDWLLQRLRDRGEPHDAVVILDADTTVAPSFLRVLDARLAAGAPVVQAYYTVANREDSTATALRTAALALRHYVRPLGRTWLGGSSGLFGNGMAFRSDILSERTWSQHLTEDVEFQLEMLLDGTLVSFAPDAVVRAEMPDTLQSSRSQHERWERGRQELARRYVPALLRSSLTGGPAPRRAFLDAALDQMVPPLSVLAALSSGLFGTAALRALVKPSTSARRRLAWSATLLGAQVGCVLAGLKLADAPPSAYRSLAAAPRAVLWKVRLWLRVSRRRSGVAWVRTARVNETKGAA